MQILTYTEQMGTKLEQLKSIVWPIADKEHYGDDQPNFSYEKLTLVAQENDDLVGYITVIVDSGVAQIEPLMVHSDLRGKGIGSALLAAAEEKAKSLGAHKVWLETGSDWAARPFYEKHGYTVRTVLPNHTSGREFVLMDKML